MGRMKNVAATIGAAAIVTAGLTAGMAPTSQAAGLTGRTVTVTDGNMRVAVSLLPVTKIQGDMVLPPSGERVTTAKLSLNAKAKARAGKTVVCQPVKDRFAKGANVAVVCTQPSTGTVRTYFNLSTSTRVVSTGGKAAYTFSRNSFSLWPNGVMGASSDPLPSAAKVYKARGGKTNVSVLFTGKGLIKERLATKKLQSEKLTGGRHAFFSTTAFGIAESDGMGEG